MFVEIVFPFQGLSLESHDYNQNFSSDEKPMPLGTNPPIIKDVSRRSPWELQGNEQEVLAMPLQEHVQQAMPLQEPVDSVVLAMPLQEHEKQAMPLQEPVDSGPPLHNNNEVQEVGINQPQVEDRAVETRKSGRASRPPIWLKDFARPGPKLKLINACLYPIVDSVMYDRLSTHYQSLLTKFSTETEPQSYHEAVKNKRWIQAMESEITALEEINIWEVVSLPVGKKAIGCKWVFKIKYTVDGEVERFKARLVAKGYNQREGLDYQETFSPVVKMVSVRAMISLVANKGWCIQQMDVYNAFLQGDLNEEVYMQLPQGFAHKAQVSTQHNQGQRVCKLLKSSLYGLKQASRQLNIKLTAALIDAGFKQCHLDYSLLIKKSDAGIVIVLIYVDDLLITGSD